MSANEEEHIYIAALIRRQLHEKLSEAEQAELDAWIGRSERNRQVYAQCLSAEGRSAAFRQLDTFDNHRAYARIKPLLTKTLAGTQADDPLIAPSVTRIPKRKQWLPYVAAAIALMVLTWGIRQPDFFRPSSDRPAKQVVDFGPAGNKALIRLSDGRNFELDEGKDKVYFNEAGISYATGETLATTESATYATISTPRGGIYQLVLPDGTNVTLNAGSSLTYPTEFTGATRHVELRGEAFFDVSRQSRPFLVETQTHSVVVLGTQFNVSAYEDEQWARTTLVEGLVQLTTAGNPDRPQLLQPGQQGMVVNGEITTSEADIASELAWFNGRFDFDGKKLGQVMRELSRWYDVDIQYEGEVPDIEFFGGTFRNSSLATILILLENSGIHYRLEADRKVVIEEKR